MQIGQFFKIPRQIYFDNNATTEVAPAVVKKMTWVLKNRYGNPSSQYKAAVNSGIILEESRTAVAKAINAEISEIIFTGSASEANNMVIKILGDKYFPEKKRILSTPIEHASVMSTLEYMQSKEFLVNYIPVDNKGIVIIDKFEERINRNTFLICCIMANNETGTIQDIRYITKLAHSKNIMVFVDCVQALGKIPIDVKDLDIDYASFSAHKIHGPKGIGALYVKSGNPVAPFIHGGHQEGGLRAGTEGLHNIAGFAEACKNVDKMILGYSKIGHLKEIFIKELRKIKSDIVINSPEDSDCLPNTLNLIFPGISNAYLMATLDHYGIAVSAGSACNTQSNEPSHVLKAIGLTDEQARESIRFSLNSRTSLSDIKYVLKVLDLFISGKLSQIGMIEPKMLNEEVLFDPQTYILDARFWYDRLFFRSLPNSHEVPFFAYKKYLKNVPRDKNIIVICQGGYLSPVVAYEMRSSGYKNVSFLSLGLLGWKMTNPVLYEKLAGQNIQKLEK